MSLNRLQLVCNYLPSGVHLLAVSKGQPASSIRELAELGQQDFGESRLQDAVKKIDSLDDLKDLRWHFIGHLQSNKVRGVVQYFDFIHSIDSYLLAERISRIAGEEERHPEGMIQVKLREDPTKGGFHPEHLLEVWPKLIGLPNLNITGLMTMAPISLDLKERRNLFKECRHLADHLGMTNCSMGMSRDWQEAVEAGATWLRLGTKLFGKRSDDVNFNTDITKDD